MLLNQVLDEYRTKAAKAMDELEAGFEDVTAVLELPEHYRKRLRTTNSLERLNEEIRRREKYKDISQPGISYPVNQSLTNGAR